MAAQVWSENERSQVNSIAPWPPSEAQSSRFKSKHKAPSSLSTTRESGVNAKAEKTTLLIKLIKTNRCFFFFLDERVNGRNNLCSGRNIRYQKNGFKYQTVRLIGKTYENQFTSDRRIWGQRQDNKILTHYTVGLFSELIYQRKTPGNSCLLCGQNVLSQHYYHTAVRLVHREVTSISLLLFILWIKVHTTGPTISIMISYQIMWIIYK